MTDQGIKDIKNAPKRIEALEKATEGIAGKATGYFTMGEYDYVLIVEAPSDEVGMTVLMGLGALGNLRTTTLKAFTLEQFAEMVKKLP